MPTSQLQLNLIEGSVSFNFTPQAAQEFKSAIAQLIESLKTTAVQSTPGTRNRPTPRKPMEYRYSGEVLLEVFCNPNIWPSPFAAKLLITVRDERLRLTTEAELTRVVEDLNIYLEQFGV
jgi:hypothetical protein